MIPHVTRIDSSIQSNEFEKIIQKIIDNSVDEINFKIQNDKNGIIADLSKIGFLSESILLGCLLKAKKHKKQIVTEFSSPVDASTKTLMTRSLLGVLLCYFSQKVINEKGINIKYTLWNSIKKYLKINRGLISSYNNQLAYIQFDENSIQIDKCRLFSEKEITRQIIKDELEEATKTINVMEQKSLYFEFNFSAWQNIILALFEVIQNTNHHALSDFESNPINGIRFFQLRRLHYKDADAKKLFGATSPLNSYFLKAKERLFNHTKNSEFIELSVSDSGVGITAKMFRSMDIYNREPEDEIEIFYKALEMGGTSEVNSGKSSRGIGLYNVMQNVFDLRALIIFRVGNLIAYRHFLNEPEFSEKGFEFITKKEIPILRRFNGTCISILIPVGK